MEERDQFAIVPLWLIELASPPALRLYAWIGSKYASRGSGDAWPSQPMLAKDLRATDRAVRNWLDELVELGAIRVEHRSGTSSRLTLIARTTPPLSARDPGTVVPGYPGTTVPVPRNARSARPGTSVPPNQKNQEPEAAPPPPARAQGGGVGAANPTDDATELVLRLDEEAAASAADPERAKAAIEEARARLRSKGRHPSTGPQQE